MRGGREEEGGLADADVVGLAHTYYRCRARTELPRVGRKKDSIRVED